MDSGVIIDGESSVRSSSILKPEPTCGACHFGHPFREGLRVVPNAVECFGAPPTPVVMGQGPGGVAMGLMRPRVANTERACALWRQKLHVAAT